MSVNDSTTSSDSTARSELLFLIAKFLSNGPCKQAADVLMRELEIHELIPKGYDWEGNQRNRSYDQLARLNSHVGPDHLLHMCQRLGPLLDQVVPTNTHGVRSLLGAGRMSLLRTPESISNPSWKLSHQMVLQNGCPRVKPKNLLKLSVVQSLHARQAAGAGMTASSIPTCLYSKVTMIDRKLGHLSSVYCVTYDRTGDFIITGADDSLVKIWHARSGRLMATLRGHAAEITDMTVNQENTLLATGSMDKSVRVWSLRTKATVAVLHGHTGYITTIQFSPQCKGNVRILMSSGYDGSVCFWLWDVNTHQFNLKPKKFVERSHAGAQMLCSSFSPGGMFVATGNSDNVIRVYFLYASEPNKICELEAHTNKVDSICYSNSFNRFVSGSEDGTARIWHYERQEWRATILSMYTRLNSDGTEVMAEEPIRAEDKLRVTMVSWNLDDTLVVTAVSDFSVKVWNSNTGKLLHVLKEHDGDVFVLDAHPMDPRILLSAGHDGNIVLWDIAEGVKIKNFFNTIQGQGNGAVYDCKFTPDGQSFAATDNHGHLLFFGFGVNEKIKQVPHEVYFHTDYRPLIRDANNFVLDEQTQQPPHLMPPPFLVNIDGNPYPPALQRLVPGREQLNNSQLVPEIAVNEAGNSEVIGEQDDQARAEMPLPEADIPAGREAEAGEAEAPVAQQAAVVPHQQDHDYSRQRAEGEGAEPTPQQNGGRVQEGYDDDTEDEDGGRLGRLEERARPSIDEMIRQLQQEQDERILAEGGALPLASPPPPAADAVPEAREGRVGMRRAGEMEGVRQLGNMQQRAASSGLPAWSKSVLVQPLSHAILKTSEARRLALADDETIRYILERKKKQSVPNTPSTLFGNMSRGKQQLQAKVEEKKKRSQLEQTARNRLTTRALYDTEEEEEETDESDRESNNSSYSDWTMEGSSNLQPPKRRSQRKPKHRQISSDDDDDDDEDEAIEIEYDDDDDEEEAVEDDHDEEYKAYLKRPKKVEKTEEVKEEGKKKGPPTAPKTKKPKKPSKKRKADSQKASASTPVELDQRYLPPEWLTGTIPRKTPYVPQMGDELMYFRQGHELYLQAVEKHKSYKLGSNISLPWHKNPQLREMELVKIVGLRYEVKPPRLCSLKLAYINWDTGKMLGGSFSIRYHDMPDVIDFLVLRQHFDIARRRNWKPGDRFRSMIDDQWWMGEIESQSPLNMMFPDSMFQCFFVHWDNGEYERLSPWDMEPINENLMPTSIGGGVPADPEELKDMLYTPKPCEWSSAGREAETERILRGLEAVMEHSVAEPFNAPVDLSAFPEYARSIEYTIDLSTIKARLENGYYRRINALQWDIRHIESNAKKFNEDGTPIFRSAGIVTDTLLRFISDPSCEDPMPILEELSGGQEFNWGNGDADDTEDEDEGASASSSTRRKRGGEGRGSRRQRGEPPPDPEEWKKRCADLLAFMQDCEDAAPFKDPVDLELYPNYLAVIETPMDLGTVGSKLSSGRYASPVDFAEDVRLIFHNSRSFNTNKRSRIYSMTLRLSAMFEEQVKTVLSSWSAVTRNKTSGSGSSRRPSAWSAAVHSGGQSAHSGGQSVCNAADRVSSSQTHQPSGSRSGTSVALRSHTLGRSSEERARGATSTRRGVSRVVSDSDKTEVEEEEETEAAGRDSSDKENYNEDEDTEVEEEESEASTLLSKNRQSAVSAHGRSQSTLNSHKCVSNGHTSYRTRAKTGSLRPKRYMSTDEEEEKDTRKNSKRARSCSSRESSLHLADEEDNDSTENSSGESETRSDSDSRTSKTRKHKSKAVKHKRRKTATRSRSRNSKKRRRREFSSGDEDNESEEESEESDSSDSESEEELVHKPKPKSRSEVNVDKCTPLKKHASSGKRTTRNQGKRTFNYLEDSYDEYEDDPSRLSVSSRGRLRKMTKRARANRTDD